MKSPTTPPNSQLHRNANSFTCAHCHRPVHPTVSGTRHRNHCPFCLWSLHVDHQPGDRTASCGGVMEPIGIAVKTNGEWAVLHRCRDCGVLRINRVAGDDNELALMSLAVRPLANPCFPLDQLAGATSPHQPSHTRGCQ